MTRRGAVIQSCFFQEADAGLLADGLGPVHDIGQHQHVGGNLAYHQVVSAFAQGVPAEVAVLDALDKGRLREALLDVAAEDGGVLLAELLHFSLERLARFGLLKAGIRFLDT